MAISPNYIFHPKLADNFLNHVEYTQFFSPPECDAIIEMALEFPEQNGGISVNNEENLEYRKSRIRWIECQYENEWLWNKLSNLALMANTEYYDFNLLGFKECIQYTEYEAPGEHYTWHMDYGVGHMSQRKLSICVQLSDPEEYEGGELELFYQADPVVAQKTRGTAVVFPSYTMHRVTPVTKGTRSSLVVWVSGGGSYK